MIHCSIYATNQNKNWYTYNFLAERKLIKRLSIGKNWSMDCFIHSPEISTEVMKLNNNSNMNTHLVWEIIRKKIEHLFYRISK